MRVKRKMGVEMRKILMQMMMRAMGSTAVILN
jgi:hypothetical protein